MKELLSKITFFLQNTKLLRLVILNHLSPLVRDDATFIKMKWKLCLDYPLNLEHPRSFNEKVQWLKLHDRKPIYTIGMFYKLSY